MAAERVAAPIARAASTNCSGSSSATNRRSRGLPGRSFRRHPSGTLGTGADSRRSSRRSRCSATAVERSRMSAREPGQVERARDPLAVAVEHRGHAEAHAPDRLVRRAAVRARRCRSGRSPCRRRSAPARRRRAPRRPRPRRPRGARSARRATPSSSVLASFEYATTPPAKYADDPGPVREPRRQQAAGARLPHRRAAGPASSAATCSSIELPSVENTESPWRVDHHLDQPLAPPRRWPRRSGSRSRARARRRQVVISSPSRPISRVRDAQRLGDLGLGDAEHPHHRLPVARRARDDLP